MHPLIQLKRAVPVSLLGLMLACFALSSSVVAFRPEAQAKASSRALTFAERVAFQHAIEDVYWRHRIWPRENPDPKPALDAVMSQAQLENKVTAYLRDSLMLQDYWQKPITAEELQAEMDRMARDTRQPDVLRELFEALGNDPAVIAECLARPILAKRLIADLSVQGGTQRFESPRTGELRTMSVATSLGQIAYTLPKIADVGDPPCTDNWTATTTTNPPEAREGHSAVWTGSEMIVWGSVGTPTGGRYIPSTNSWTATSTTNAPSARGSHTAVWTGSEMIVWGGTFYDGTFHYWNTGGRYNPGTDTWTATSTTNAPIGRFIHTAVWTGSEMIVWGGAGCNGGCILNTGGRYNPSTNSWTATSTTNAPSERYLHTAVWTGSEMIVWGGDAVDNGYSNTGGRYNPGTNSWTATSTTNAPTGRYFHTAVWIGSEMILWGGYDNVVGHSNTGGRYRPSTNSWTATSTTNAPDGRAVHTAVWTGSEMIVWGGSVFGGFVNTGGRYNPGTSSWTATSTINAPSGRYQHTAVWTGSEMIVWGGGNGYGVANTGGRYCAQSGPTPTPTPPVASPYDFNHDTKPDFVLLNPSTRQRAVWYMNNNVRIGGAFTPALPVGWSLIDVADFNGDANNDYALFNASTGQTALWYLSGLTRIGGHYGPTLPNGWALVATGDFNADGRPDYVLFKASTRQTSIWYLNDNVYVGAAFGPSIPAPWTLAGIADFNRDGNPDYLLFNPSTRYTVIWYMSGPARMGSAFGPTIAAGHNLAGAADFNGDAGAARPDYVLFNPSTRVTTLWYMDNNVRIGTAAAGPPLSAGWSVLLP
jgi:hypothetical protein